MPASSIGSYYFIRISAQPVPAGQALQPETKAGVAGVGWWKCGVKGTEYSVETIADALDFATAVSAATGYKAAQDAGALAIVYGGISLGNVIVISVDAKAEAIAYGQGGLSGVSQAIVRANWRLIAV
jgi:hypothetical protein